MEPEPAPGSPPPPFSPDSLWWFCPFLLEARAAAGAIRCGQRRSSALIHLG
jgi:hypothetical protein